MTTLTITLPDDAVAFIEEEARRGQVSVDEYLGAVVRQIRLRAAKRKLEAKIQEALDSGPAVPVTPEFWEDLRREVFERLDAEQPAR